METPQLHNGIRTPDMNSRYRALFEQHYRAGNTPEVRYVSIGSEIELVQDRLRTRTSTLNGAWDMYFDAYKDGLEHYVHTQAEQLRCHDSASVDLHYRAQLHAELIDQHVLLPILFSANVDDYESLALRRKLIQRDGMYGIIAGQVESVYEASARVLRQSEDASILIGLLSEETSLAVANLKQNANAVALPALPYDDWSGNTDLLFYGYEQKTPVIYRRHVKSNEQLAKGVRNDPTCIGGVALGNSALSHHWRPSGGKG